jgi:hypothetical protein
MDDQAYIFSFPPMAGLSHSLMDNESIRSSIRYGINGLLQIDQPSDWPNGYAMIQRDNHRFPSLSVHDPFHANSFSNHDLFPPLSKIKKAVREIFPRLKIKRPRVISIYPRPPLAQSNF